MKNVFQFNLYGEVVNPHITLPICNTYDTFLAEEGIPIKNMILGLNLDQYDKISDYTSKHIFVITRCNEDNIYEEITRFSSIEDILHYFNNTTKCPISLNRRVERADIVQSLRNKTPFCGNIVVFKLSIIPIKHRRRRLKFDIVKIGFNKSDIRVLPN